MDVRDHVCDRGILLNSDYRLLSLMGRGFGLPADRMVVVRRRVILLLFVLDFIDDGSRRQNGFGYCLGFYVDSGVVSDCAEGIVGWLEYVLVTA